MKITRAAVYTVRAPIEAGKVPATRALKNGQVKFSFRLSDFIFTTKPCIPVYRTKLCRAAISGSSWFSVPRTVIEICGYFYFIMAKAEFFPFSARFQSSEGRKIRSRVRKTKSNVSNNGVAFSARKAEDVANNRRYEAAR